MNEADKFIKIANEIFGIGSESGRGYLNPFYVDVPAVLSKGRLAKSPDFERNSCLTNPFIFLGNIQSATITSYPGQYTAEFPSLSVVVGQYGYGKTELVHQLCYLLKNSGSLSYLTPLPINLAFSRQYIEFLNRSDSPRAEEFSYLLFEHILKQDKFSNNFLNEKLIPLIHNGNLLLILDGLDELLSNTIQYHNFFKGLIKLLNLESKNYFNNAKFKVLICTRIEYLLSVDTLQGNDLVEIVNRQNYNTSPPKIYFLNLDCFDNSRIKSYIKKILIDENEFFEKIKENSRLLDILRRPLLLRIFCDLAKNYIYSSAQIEILLQVEYPGELLEIFIEQASTDETLLQSQKIISDHTWDIDKLAYKSLQIYQDGLSEMSIVDIKDFIKSAQASIESLHGEEIVLRSIHKCPFLQRVSEDKVRFSHRSFFEFFIAKGVALEIKNGNQKPFDELVLNVDTRKFLKYLVNKLFNSRTKFDELTRYSYGFFNKEQWKLKCNFSFEEIADELEDIRSILLLSMTEPENPPNNTEEKIKRFLDIEDWGLHPRYLMYSYEAVAVYLRDHQWESKSRDISKLFSKKLEFRLIDTLNILNKTNNSNSFKNSLELLTERILDIGQRLRYSWTKLFLEKSNQENLLQIISDPDTRERVQAILIHIHHSIL